MMAVGHWAEDYLDGGKSAGGVSVYEAEADFENMTLTAKVSAGELFDATKSGYVILHGFVTMSGSAYQESTLSVVSSSLSVSGSNKMYAFSVRNGDAVATLTANSSDAFPTATLGD